jgi:hypothetical protein
MRMTRSMIRTATLATATHKIRLLGRSGILGLTLVSLTLSGCHTGEPRRDLTIVEEATRSTASPQVTSPPPSPLPPPQKEDFCPESVSWSKAKRHVGEVQRIEGPVVGAVYASTSNGQPTFLNIGRDYPNRQRFTVVIWGDDRPSFGFAPEKRYSGRQVCIRGRISTFRGVPQIIAASPSDIEINN